MKYYLVSFNNHTIMVEAADESQVEDFMRINHDLSPDDYWVNQAIDEDVNFIKNSGGKIYAADKPIIKEG